MGAPPTRSSTRAGQCRLCRQPSLALRRYLIPTRQEKMTKVPEFAGAGTDHSDGIPIAGVCIRDPWLGGESSGGREELHRPFADSLRGDR